MTRSVFAGAHRLLFTDGTASSSVAQTLLWRLGALTVSFGTGVVTARALGTAGRGEFTAIGLWPQLLAYLLTFGVPISLIYNVRRMPERRDEFFSAAVVIAVVSSICAGIVGVFVIPIALAKYPHWVVMYGQVAMIFGPQFSLGLVLGAAFESRGDFRDSNLLRNVSPFAILVLLFGLLLTHRFTPVTAFFAYSLPPLVSVAYFLRRELRSFVRSPGAILTAARQLLSYGLRAYIIDVLNTISTQVDQLLVVGFLSASELGLYSVALSASRVLVVAHGSIVTVLLPRALSLDESDAFNLIGRATRISLALTGAAGVGLALFAPVLVPRLYGAGFWPSVGVVQILSLEAVLSGAVYVLAQGFMISGQPTAVSTVQAVGLALTVPLMLLLMPRFGLLGAASALCLSTSARLIFVMAAYPLRLRRAVPSLILTPADLRYLRQKVMPLLAHGGAP